jgi:hypothetical protein
VSEACSGALSTGEGIAFGAGRFATHGMPRRDKQFRSKRSQFCWLQAGAGGAESSALARSRSSSVGGSNASTPIRPAHPTSEAEITKRRFEYKALSPSIGNLGPPCCPKTTPLWRDYVRLGGLIPVELAAVLNGRPAPSAALDWGTLCKVPRTRGKCRVPQVPRQMQDYSNSSRKGSAS